MGRLSRGVWVAVGLVGLAGVVVVVVAVRVFGGSGAGAAVEGPPVFDGPALDGVVAPSEEVVPPSESEVEEAVPSEEVVPSEVEVPSEDEGDVAADLSAEEARQAELFELRRSDQFDEFKSWELAENADWAYYGPWSFAVFEDREPVFRWSNEVELWNQIAPPIRDELLLLGPEVTEPVWDEENVLASSVDATWTDESTGGRGQFIHFLGWYLLPNGEPRIRVYAILVATDRGSGEGRVVGQMPPFEVGEPDAESYEGAFDYIYERTWEWVREQPVL